MKLVNVKLRAGILIALAVAVVALGSGCGEESVATPSSEPAPTATSTLTPSPAPATSIPTPSSTQVPSPTPTPELESTGEVVRRITEQVSELRGLEATQDMPIFFISSERMAKNIRQSIEEEYTQEEADIDAEVFALLDFIEPGTNLKEAFADLYAGAVVGYYDTDTGEMFVLNDGDEPTPAAKYTLAHEIVHALQDKAFDLDAFLPEDEENGDLARAKMALVEGDAVLASTEYLQTHLTRSEWRQMYSAGGGDTDLSEIPRALIEFLTFPYREGAAFVTAVHDSAGWDSVDAAFGDPPLSTEHILHPDKYFAGELPVIVRLPKLASALGGGWETQEEGVLGEFVIALYLENRLSKARAASAAEFWGGDAYALIRNEELDESALVSFSVWDTAKDAQEFFDALAFYFDAPGSESGDLTVSAEGVRRWNSEERTVYAAVEDDEALLIISESDRAVEALIGEFPWFQSGEENTLWYNFSSRQQVKQTPGMRKGVTSDTRRNEMGKPIEVGDESWKTEVLESDVPVLVDFWAPWCGPCRMIAPIVEELASEYEGKMTFAKLNVDEAPEVTTGYRIRSIPTVMFFKDGSVAETVVGAVPKRELVKKVESVLA